MQQQTQETIKHTADWLAVGTTLGTIFEILPAIAALFTVIWTGIRIYEWWMEKRKKDQPK